MRFDVSVGPSLTHNALLNRANKDAAYRQTEVEHNELLNKYVKPTDTPVERMEHLWQGVEEEKNYPKYWDDETPRKNFNPSSSFIEGVDIVPALRLARIRMNGRSYSYPLDDMTVGNMLTNNSIGQFYNQFIKRG